MSGDPVVGSETNPGDDLQPEGSVAGIPGGDGAPGAGDAAAAGTDGADASLPEQAGPTAADPVAVEAGGGEGQALQRVSELEQELAALRAQHDTLNGQYMRLAADFDNFRKRQSRDSEDQRLQITCTTLSEILPVLDNFDRARQQLTPQHEEAQTLHRSYQGLYRQLVEVFKQLGVSPMRVEGEPFDPMLHEAVMREPSEQHPEDVVIEELQRGYHLNGRVLRHALVKVSMGPGPADGGGREPAGPGPEGSDDPQASPPAGA